MRINSPLLMSWALVSNTRNLKHHFSVDDSSHVFHVYSSKSMCEIVCCFFFWFLFAFIGPCVSYNKTNSFFFFFHFSGASDRGKSGVFIGPVQGFKTSNITHYRADRKRTLWPPRNGLLWARFAGYGRHIWMGYCYIVYYMAHIYIFFILLIKRLV